MPASQPANFNLQEFTDAGQLLVGGRLYTYAYGTTAQKTAFTDPAGTIPHTYTNDGAGGQYIALNARGELPAPLYLGTGAYDISLKRADGSTVWTRKAEGVANAANAAAAALAAPGGASLIGSKAGPLDQVIDGLTLRTTSNFSSIKNMKKGLLDSGETAVLEFGTQAYCGGYNGYGDGGGAMFEVVAPDAPIGILSDDGVCKFRRISGHDSMSQSLAVQGPVIAAHRGYAGISIGEPVGGGVQGIGFVPENTIQALNFAASRGAWGVEGDTQITSDGQLVVMHDDTVNRVTGGVTTGLVKSFTLAQLKAMDVGSYASPRYADARVMDYAEWFYWCRRLGLSPVAEVSVELTNALANKFVQAMHAQYTNGKGVIVYGTSLATLALIRSKSAECALAISVGYGVAPTAEVLDYVYELGNAGAMFTGGVLSTAPESISLADERGLFTMYAIANTPGAITSCARLGIDIVVSDLY